MHKMGCTHSCLECSVLFMNTKFLQPIHISKLRNKDRGSCSASLHSILESCHASSSSPASWYVHSWQQQLITQTLGSPPPMWVICVEILVSNFSLAKAWLWLTFESSRQKKSLCLFIFLSPLPVLSLLSLSLSASLSPFTCIRKINTFKSPTS